LIRGIVLDVQPDAVYTGEGDQIDPL